MSEAQEDRVLVHREGSIAILTLNFPKRMNAFGIAMRQQMWDRLLELESDEDVRAIVLTGAGGNFCAGGDITEMESRPVLKGRMRMELAVRIFRLLVTGPKPFICAIEGNAAGCGVSFAAASDYCVAASDAKFKIAFIKVGLIPDVGGLWSIPRKIGHRKAMELAAFAEAFDAAKALQLQLINEVCEPGKALERGIADRGEVRAESAAGKRAAACGNECRSRYRRRCLPGRDHVPGGAAELRRLRRSRESFPREAPAEVHRPLISSLLPLPLSGRGLG